MGRGRSNAGNLLGEVQSGVVLFEALRANDALFDISLPRFVISDAAFGLFASQLHFLGYVVDALGPIFFLSNRSPWRSQIKLVREWTILLLLLRWLERPVSLACSVAPFRRIFFDADFTREEFSNCERNWPQIGRS